MAISASSYSVGNRLYKGATSAPTRGRVDPTGYVDRELNKVASNSRSGIASAALRRMGSPTGVTQQSSQSAAPSQSSQVATSGQTQTSVNPTGGMNSNPLSKSPLGVSPIGKLRIKPPVDNSLPFDPEAASAQQDLLEQKNMFEYNAGKSERDLERDYTLNKRNMEIERPNTERSLLENYAGRGMAYSSGYAHDRSELGNQYSRMGADLEGQRTQGLAELLEQRGMFNNNYASRMNAIQEAAARKAAERAADLALQEQNDIAARQAEHDAIQAEQLQNPTFTPGAGEVPNNGPYIPDMAPQPGIATGMRPNPAGGFTPSFTPSAPIGDQPMQQPAMAPQQMAPQQAEPAPVQRSHNRTLASFDPKSRTVLSQGGTIVGGNGMRYKYDPLTGQAVPV